MSNLNEIAANPGPRPMAAAGRPTLPGWNPPPTEAMTAIRPTGGDPREAAPPVRNDYPTAVGPPAVASARTPMLPDLSPRRSPSGDLVSYGPTTRTNRSRHRDEEVDLDVREVATLRAVISQAELEELAALDCQRKQIDEERRRGGRASSTASRTGELSSRGGTTSSAPSPSHAISRSATSKICWARTS